MLLAKMLSTMKQAPPAVLHLPTAVIRNGGVITVNSLFTEIGLIWQMYKIKSKGDTNAEQKLALTM